MPVEKSTGASGSLTVILLAGGESTRFWPMSEKNLLPFMGKSLLAWHYRQLVAVGAKRVCVVANPTNVANVKSVEVPVGLDVGYCVQDGVGQGNAVLASEGIVSHGPVVILNSSDWYDDGFLSEFMDAAPEGMKLGAVRVSRYFPGGYLKLKDDGSVAEILEKPGEGNEPSDIVRIVADAFPDMASLLSAVREVGHDPVSGYERAVNAMIAAGTRCEPVVTSEKWLAVKYPWHVLDVMEQMLSGISGPDISPDAVIASSAVITGPVVIESGVRVFEGAKIVGPCWIGKDAIIGNNSMVRESMIGERVVTGFSSDITRSWIGADSWFHTNYVGDSIIGSNVSMGSGTVLANLRLDEGEIGSVVKGNRVMTQRTKLGGVVGNGCRIGVNVSTLPGVKIGAGTFIAGGITVSADVPDNSFVKPKEVSYEVIKNRTSVTVGRDEFRKKI